MMRSAPFARPIVFTAPELIRNVSGSISVPEVRRIHIGPYLSAAPQLISMRGVRCQLAGLSPRRHDDHEAHEKSRPERFTTEDTEDTDGSLRAVRDRRFF